MKTTTNYKIIILIIINIIFQLSCEKDKLVKVTKLETGTVTNITANSATVSATFSDISGNVSEFGHCWATTSNPTTSDNKCVVSGTAKKGDFSSNLSGLTGGTKYYVKAYAKDGDRLVYGNVIDFSTPDTKTITVTFPTKGVKWMLNSIQTISWSDNIAENIKIELYKGGSLVEPIITSTPSNGSYSWTVKSTYTPAIDYSIKISSIENAGISAESEKFEIAEGLYISITDPISTTNWQKGSNHLIKWTDNIAENVKIELFKGDIKNSDITTNTSSDGSENWTVPTSLLADNNYKIKITSVSDVSVSDESENFAISDVPPTVITQAATSITGISATLNGTVNANGGSYNVSFEWGESEAYGKEPVIASPVSVNGNSVTSVSAGLTGLESGKTYHFRLKAGDTYGDDISFTTSSLALISTTAVASITHNSAVSGGNITSDGGSSITERGVCWSTSPNPTLENNLGKTTNGNGSGSFTSNLTGLNANTEYHVKAYATNGVGTAYGGDQPFSTTEALYININWPGTGTHWLGLDTANIKWTSNLSGQVSIDLYKGDTWLKNITTANASDNGFTWNSVMDNQFGTDYKVRITSQEAGNFFKESNSFKISESNGTTGSVKATTYSYNTIKIGYQWWMASNLKEFYYTDGNSIPWITGNTEWANLGSTDKGYCYYENSADNLNKYGNIYTWSAATNGELSSNTNPSGVQGICPTGWHLPSESEWEELKNYLTENGYGFEGSGNDVGKSLAKSSGWTTSGTPGQVGNDQTSNNTSGFTGVPGGYRSSTDGIFWSAGTVGYWWCAKENNSSFGINFGLASGYSVIITGTSSKSMGCSVRCVKD